MESLTATRNLHGMHKGNMSGLAEVEIIQFCNDVFVKRAGFEEVGQFFVECCLWALGGQTSFLG